MDERAKDRRWLLKWAILMIVLTTIPLVMGFALTRNSMVQFSGFLFGVEDGNSYLAKMLSGSIGDWLFRTPYSAYPQNGFLAFLPYLLLGKLASQPDIHVQLIAIFQIFRWLGILFLIYETYNFAKIFLYSGRQVKIAVIISSVGGGLGWLVIILSGKLPLEFYSPEAFGFLSFFGLPHLLFARGLMLRAMRMLLEPGLDFLRINRKITSGFYLFLSGLFQPLNIPLAWLVVAVWKAVEFILTRRVSLRKWIGEFFYFYVIPLPFFLYNAYMFLFDPYLSVWEGQNIIKSPPPLDFLWAYGFGFGCIALVMWKMKTSIREKVFLLSWCFLLPILVYLPINLQRRLSDGYWVILSIFIAIVISRIKKPAFRTLAIIAISLSTIFFYSGAVSSVLNLMPPMIQTRSLVEGMHVINIDCLPKDVVLAPYDVSNVLPAYIPVRVVTGHGPESKNLAEIQIFVDDFFSQINLEGSKDFFNQFQISYIVFPQTSRVDKTAWWYQNSELLFENGDFAIYKIVSMGEL